MKKLYLVLLVFFAIVAVHQATFANCIQSYKSSYGFNIEIPIWEITEVASDDKCETTIAHSKNVYIKILVMPKSNSEYIVDTLLWKIWTIDPNAYIIFQFSTNEEELLIANYRDKVYKIHRFRIIHTQDKTFIIECCAPENTFYNFEIYFSRAFKTFTILQD